MIEITMPRLSDTMEEGVIAAWRVSPGDTVSPGDVLAEIETDKAVMDFEAYDSGTIIELLAEPGTVVPIGRPIALLDDGSGVESSDDVDDAVPSSPSVLSPEPPADFGQAAEPVPEPGLESEPEPEPLRASPLVRRMARDHDIDLHRVAGSGPGGRIIRLDIERALAGRGRAAVANAGPGEVSGTDGTASEASLEASSVAVPGARISGQDGLRDSAEVPVSALRRVIARRLTQAAREVPVFTVTMAVRADALQGARSEMNRHLAATGRGKVSVNDLIVRAAALALREHQDVNASWDGERIQIHGRVNIGIAVATGRGLMVPVVMDADLKTPAQIGAEARSLAGLAAESKLAPEQMSGGTFTVSNLGMYGVEQFTAIINPPEAAILAVGAALPEVKLEGANVVSHQVMRLTLSSDHRLIDGALAAQFLGTVRDLVENPWSLLA
jgi:pyruvate dehydrogenase E2 component (dihydrolipoamide acetyltransferase)